MKQPAALKALEVHRHRLPNGLTLLIREDRSADVVAVVTHVKAGYFSEPDPLVGISHVLEHMYFKGTARRGPGDMARETKELGGYINAGTIYDYTSYYTVLPSSGVELALDIQADALRNSSIDAGELSRELGVIIEEAKRKLDNPGAVAIESLYATMFDVHRMRRWRIGEEEGLRALTREDVVAFYRSWYRPGNVVLVVAGAVDPGVVREIVERLYGDMPAGTVPDEESPAEPDRRGLRYREISGDISQAYLEWGWPTPGTLHADTPLLSLLSIALGQGRASRLYREVREAGVVSGIGAYNYTPTEIGVLGIGAELEPADLEEAALRTWRAVESLRRNGPREAEVARARNIMEARFVSRLETAEGQARLLAEWEAMGDWRLASSYYDALMSANAGDLQRVAREYLVLDRAAVLLYRPESAPPSGWTAEELAARLGSAASGALAADQSTGAGDERITVREPQIERAETLAAAAGEGVGAAAGPAAFGAAESGVYGTEIRPAGQGATVVVRPRPGSALVTVSICCRGGRLHEGPGTAGSTVLMARSALKGTARRDAHALAVATEALGGAISVGLSSDLLSWSLTVPARHFETGFRLLAEAALTPVFPEPEVARERKVALSELEQVTDDMYRYPMRLFFETAFAGHSYGLALDALARSIEAATPESLAGWHGSVVKAGHPIAFVVGGVEADRAAGLAEELLSAVPASGGPPEAHAFPSVGWPEGGGVRAVHRTKAQTGLVLGFPGPRRGDPALPAMQVLSHVLSGLGGRLFEELRGRRSLAYTVAAYPVPRWLGGAFVCYIGTSPDREEEAREGILRELDRILDEPVGADELRRAHEYAVGTWKIRSQTNSAQLADMTEALLLGGGLAELESHEERIRSVTARDVTEAFRRFYDPERRVEGVVRGSSVASAV